MRYALLALLLLGCQSPTEVQHDPGPPAVMFVNACGEPAVFQVSVDGVAAGGPAQWWYMAPGVTYTYPTTAGRHEVGYWPFGYTAIVESLTVSGPTVVRMTCR